MLFSSLGILWIDHVAVTTANFNKTLEDYLAIDNARLIRGPGWNPDQNVHFAFVSFAGDMMVEILGLPEDGVSPIAAHVQSGGGAYHVCYAVADIDVAIGKAVQEGARLIVEPRSDTAFDGRRVAFLLHPDHGVFELVEAYGKIATQQSASSVDSVSENLPKVPKISDDIEFGLKVAFGEILPEFPKSEYEMAKFGMYGWDSLAHLRLVMVLEAKFGISVNSERIATLVSWDALSNYLQESLA